VPVAVARAVGCSIAEHFSAHFGAKAHA
jgi:hypothetical protein